MRSSDEVLFSFFLLLALVLCFQLCSTGDTLKAGQKITLNSMENLVSSSRTFELGFFSLNDSSRVVKSYYYLGIWYQFNPQTVVWVANRDKPVLDSSGVFRIAEDGNLVVEGASKRHWSSVIEAPSSTNRTLKLLESGNLVLMDDNSGTSNYLWQSFENPTDTFLPDMKMDASLALTSWRNPTDPAPGNFTFRLLQIDERPNYAVLINHSQLYWTADGLDAEMIPKEIQLNAISFGWPQQSRLVMNYSGEIQFLEFNGTEWVKKWWKPDHKCDIRDYCGSFAICNKNNRIHCKCLPGFIPGHEGEFPLQGCKRKSTLSCVDTNVMFLNLTSIKVGNPPEQEISIEKEEECKSFCLNTNKCPESQCQAYSYTAPSYDRGSYTCKIWKQDLSTLVEEYDRGRNLSILLKTSDIGILYLVNSFIHQLFGKLDLHCFVSSLTEAISEPA